MARSSSRSCVPISGRCGSSALRRESCGSPPGPRRKTLVPGYPLEPRFEPGAYAARFGGTIERVDDAAHGGHPCERYDMTLPSGDHAVVWVARDLERLVVRIEHSKKNPSDEFQPFTVSELLDVRVGASKKLFEAPSGYARASSFEELSKS